MRASFLAAIVVCVTGSTALAQVPVLDSANLQKSTEIARTTNQILEVNREIMQYTQRTLQAVTGDRTGQASSLAQMALGGGFSMAQAPSIGALLSGGPLSLQGLGSSQTIVSQMINGLQLVQSLSGLINGNRTANDRAYASAVNLAATLAGMVASTQGAIQTRSQAFAAGGQQIGAAPDLKASIDQNTQVQIQTGLTINEMTGVLNNAVAAANQANLDRLQLMSSTARALGVTPTIGSEAPPSQPMN